MKLVQSVGKILLGCLIGMAGWEINEIKTIYLIKIF